MIQHHLNESRRKDVGAILAEGPAALATAAQRRHPFRGGGIPEAHIAFYQALAGTGRVLHSGAACYKLQEERGHGFMSRAKPDPKVLWTIKLKDRESWRRLQPGARPVVQC